MATSPYLRPLELISTLWDSAPRIPVPTAVPMAVVHGTNVNSVPLPSPTAVGDLLAPSGLCGWMPTEAGGPDALVCHAFGTLVPGIVFFASLLIVVATAFFLVRYLFRSVVLSDELSRLTEIVGRAPHLSEGDYAARASGAKILEAMREIGQKVPPIDELAERIEKSLVSFPGTGEGRVALRKNAAVLAGEIRKTERWSGEALAQALPGWLTAIGLLTTFIAILLGLQGVKVMSDLEVHGIGGLVNGLSGKFFSSIIALGCAMITTIMQYFVSGFTGARWTRLIYRLQERLPDLSVERLVMNFVFSAEANPKQHAR